ncbi:hypothetical protein SNEBB_005082 [Seison nebaliae]|nr:hypothetical protein SNEBB_005082 [Seison nebaliae]
MKQFILILFFVVSLSHAYPKGKHLPQSVCRNGIPGHGAKIRPMNSSQTSPYQIFAFHDKSRTSGPFLVNVAIIGRGKYFEGFLFRMMSKTTKKLVDGEWYTNHSSKNNYVLKCGTSSALAHSSSKNKLNYNMAVWSMNRPVNYKDLELHYTIVEEFADIYKGQQPVELMIGDMKNYVVKKYGEKIEPSS